jgi:hypothetical protein
VDRFNRRWCLMANPINEAAAAMIDIELRGIIGGRYSVATRTPFLYTHPPETIFHHN